jgi:hypothetical protein
MLNAKSIIPYMYKIYTKNTLLILLMIGLLFPLLSYKSPATDWVRVQVDSTISVQFPGQPTAQVVNGIQVYALRTSEAVFATMIIDQTPKPGEKPLTDTHSFYLGFMDSMIRNAKATLADSVAFTVGEYKGMDFSYTSILVDGNKITRRNRAVFINNKVYSLAYTPSVQPTPASQTTEKRFLESIQVSK